MQIKRGLFVVVVDVDPGLQVGDVQGVTQGLDVRAQNEVIGSKQSLNAVADLVANLGNIQLNIP